MLETSTEYDAVTSSFVVDEDVVVNGISDDLTSVPDRIAYTWI